MLLKRTLVVVVGIAAVILGGFVVADDRDDDDRKTVVEALELPTLTPHTLVKNELMSVHFAISISDLAVEKPKLQIFDLGRGRNGKWVKIGSLRKVRGDKGSFDGTFWFLDTGEVTHADKKKRKKVKKMKFAVASPVRLRLFAESDEDDDEEGDDDQEIAFVSPEFSLDFLNVDLPPDPGEVGKQTLEGVDSDADGIRDDVQRYVVLTYPDSEKTRAALIDESKATTQLLLSDGSLFAARAAFREIIRAGSCLGFVLTEEDGYIASEELEVQTVNTPARFRAYMNGGDDASGEVYDSPPSTSWKSACSFDPDLMEN